MAAHCRFDKLSSGDQSAVMFLFPSDAQKMLKTVLVPLGFNPHYLRFNEGEKQLRSPPIDH